MCALAPQQLGVQDLSCSFLQHGLWTTHRAADLHNQIQRQILQAMIPALPLATCVRKKRQAMRFDATIKAPALS